MNRVRNEEVRGTGVTRELTGRVEQCVLRWFGHRENGGRRHVDEKNSRIRCKMCDVERKTGNGIDGHCESNVE